MRLRKQLILLVLALFAAASALADEEAFAKARQKLMNLLRSEGVRDEAVLKAMAEVPRHHFVPFSLQNEAYLDTPLPIGENQTISQPYIVAFMTEQARIKPGDRVLEIGTGSGYQAAVLSRLGSEVYTIEIIPSLAKSARERLEKLRFKNISVRCGDGYAGWPEKAPFAAIIVTAAPDHVPKPLLDQLTVGGRMVIPVGADPNHQSLKVITKTKDGSTIENVLPVRFVPMTGSGVKDKK